MVGDVRVGREASNTAESKCMSKAGEGGMKEPMDRESKKPKLEGKRLGIMAKSPATDMSSVGGSRRVSGACQPAAWAETNGPHRSPPTFLDVFPGAWASAFGGWLLAA